MNLSLRAKSALLFSAILLSAGCSPSLKANNPYILRLKNRGPVPLSADNPFLAANALLIKEMEESPELKGFLEHRTRPAAIEVHQRTFFPLSIELYYPDKLQYYTLEEVEKTWVINGPYQITGEKFEQLKPITIFSKDAPFNLVPQPNLPPAPLKIPPTHSAVTGEINPRKSMIEKEPTPERVKPEAVNTTPPPVTKSSGANLNEIAKPGDFSAHATTESSTQLAAPGVDSGLPALVKQYGLHPTETTPKGDVVHYVVTPGETLALISRWYTFDPGNQAALARINKISDLSSLSIGDTIVIPKYMLKNDKRLTEEALAALETAVADGEIK